MSQEYPEQTPTAAEASGPEQQGPAEANAEPKDEIHQTYSPHFAPILFRWCCKNCTNMNGINLNREILEWDAAASAVLARNRRRREQYLMMKASHKQINRQLQQDDMQYNADGGTDSYPPPPPPPVSDPLPTPPPFPALTDSSDRELCAECGAARISTEELLRLTLGPEAAAAVAAYGLDLNDVLKHNPDKGEVGQGIDGPDDVGKGVVAPCSGVVDPRGSTALAVPSTDAVLDADRDDVDTPPSSAVVVSKPLPAIPLQSASSLDPVIAGSSLASFRRLIGAEPIPRHASSATPAAPAQSAASAPADWNSFAHPGVGMLPVARSVTGIGFDPRMMLHREIPSERLLHRDLPPVPSPEHPERPDRLKAIMQHLVAVGLYQRCVAVNSREATQAELATMHTAMHCQTITELESPDAEPLLGDTFACVESPLAARLAVGTLLNVTEAVCHGHITNGIAVVRPPGHHAEADRAMGFCLYNNAAVAAHVAKTQWGAKRVLVMDWDVHHGNGTQHLLDHDPDIMYMSIHRYDNGTFFPGTGAADEVGLGAARGTTVNIPWPCGGMGDAEYMAAFSDVVMPIAHQFSPDLVIISAGFDAADGDPLGGCRVTPAGYAHMTAMLSSLAHGKVVLALEGGYNLTCISRSMEACVRVMLGENPPVLKEDPDSMSVSDTGLDWMMAGQLMDSDDEDMKDGHSDSGSGAGSAASWEQQPQTTAAATAAATTPGSERPTVAGVDGREEGPPESTPASQDGSEGPAGGYTSDGVDDHVMAEPASAPAAATASAPDAPTTSTATATDASKGPATLDSPVHDSVGVLVATDGPEPVGATETQPPPSQPSEQATTAPTQTSNVVDAILPPTAGPSAAPSSSSGSSATSDSSSNSSVVSSEASAHLDRERMYHRILAARQRQQHRHAERHAASDSVLPCFPAPRAEAARTIAQVMIIQSPFWSCMRMKVGALAQIASMYPSMGQALRRIVQSTPGPSRDFRIGSEMVGQAHFASGASSPSSSQVSDSDATTPRRARSHVSRTTGGGEDGDESMLGGSPDTRGSVLSRTGPPHPAATNSISGDTAAHEGRPLGQPTALQSSTHPLAPASAVAEMATGLPQGHIAGLAAVTGASISNTLYPQDLHERPTRRMSVGGRPPPTAAPSLVSDATAVAGGTTSRGYGGHVGTGGGGPVDLSFMQPTASAPQAFAPPGAPPMQEPGMSASLHAQSSSSDPFLQASSGLLPPSVPGHNDGGANTTGLAVTPTPDLFRDSFPPWSVTGTRASSEANSHQIHTSTTSPSDSLQLGGVPGATASFGYPDLNSPGHRFSPSLLSPHAARDPSAPGLTPTLPHVADVVDPHRTVSSDQSTPLGSAESSLRFAWAGAACVVSQGGAVAMTGASTVCTSVVGETTVGGSSAISSAPALGGKEDPVLLPAHTAMKSTAGVDSTPPPPLASSASPATKRAATELAAAESQAKKLKQ